MEKRDLIKMYNLPEEVKFCKKCTMSNQRPRITFDENGVCSACNYAEHKKDTNWNEREKELTDLLDQHRRSDGSHDVIVPCSGGKDGSFVAHQLKYKYNMNPLTVTWAPLEYTEIGKKNINNFINSGFDNILFSPNQKVKRMLANLAFKHLGDPFQPFIYGVANFPMTISVNYNIPLIMYGENGEVEYGGDMKNAFKAKRDISDVDKHYFSNFPPEVWKEYGISNKDIYPYLPPEFEKIKKNNTEIHSFGYYKKWDPQENYYYACKNTGFTSNPERTEGTYSKYASLDDKMDGYHYYLSFIKFGIGRATSDSAHEIRDEKITREEGIALVKKYDDEFPKRYFKEFLEYCDISEDEFWEVIDSWRSDHIWEKTNGVWNLKKTVY